MLSENWWPRCFKALHDERQHTPFKTVVAWCRPAAALGQVEENPKTTSNKAISPAVQRSRLEFRGSPPRFFLERRVDGDILEQWCWRHTRHQDAALRALLHRTGSCHLSAVKTGDG